jgi:hypothetical protein
MRYLRLLMAFATLSLMVVAQPALAQIGALSWDYYGGYGSWGAYNSSSILAQNAQLASSSRAQAQNSIVQSGIRSTLTQQAQSQSQNLANQRQDYKDWWYQTQQQQQLAASQARANSAGKTSASFVSYQSPSASNVIQWPLLLQDPIFTRLRASIEDPYLSNPTGPTAQDFKDMVKTVAQMKDLVNQKMAFDAGIPEEQAQTADKFLDQLAKEASSNAAQLEAATRGSAPPSKKP